MRLLRRLSEGEWIVLIGGTLLIVHLLLMPWHDIDLGGADVALDTTRTAVQSPYSGYGVAAVALTTLMVVQIVLARLTPVRLPEPPVPWTQVQLIAGIFVAVVLVIKLVRETAFLGYGAYSGVVGGLLVAYAGYRISQQEERLAH